MADTSKPDLCVIGATAVGITLARRAVSAGLSVVLIDPAEAQSGANGQESLRRAAFAASATRAHLIRTAAQLGLGKLDPKPNFRAVAEHAERVAAGTAPVDAPVRLEALGITVLSGPTAFVDKATLRCAESLLRPRHIALAMDGVPLIPSIQGLDSVSYFTADTIGENMRKLTHLLVIGGTAEALELAQAYARLGSQVTLVPQGGLLPGIDRELVDVLLRALRDDGVMISEDAEVAEITARKQGTGVTLRSLSGSENLDVSHILVAMGNMPVLDDAIIGKASLKRRAEKPQCLQLRPDGLTSNSRVSAVGGTAGDDQFHVADHRATMLVARLAGRRSRLVSAAVLSLVSTTPAIAQWGTLDAAVKAGSGEVVLRANLAESTAARATGNLVGSAKLLATADGRVVGAGMVGHGAAEAVSMLSLMAGQGARLSHLESLFLPAESLLEPFRDIARQHAARQHAGQSARGSTFLQRFKR